MLKSQKGIKTQEFTLSICVEGAPCKLRAPSAAPCMASADKLFVYTPDVFTRKTNLPLLTVCSLDCVAEGPNFTGISRDFKVSGILPFRARIPTRRRPSRRLHFTSTANINRLLLPHCSAI